MTNSHSNTTKFKIKKPEVAGLQYYILAFFWLILVILLIATTVIFIRERYAVNNSLGPDVYDNWVKEGNYQELMKIKYPWIDFSLFSFVIGSNANNPDLKAAWVQRLQSINLAYSYIFITALIALIGLVFYLVIIYKITKFHLFQKKYNLTSSYPNEFPIFGTKMYLNFICGLAIVFSFFNFLSTIVVLFYGIFLVIVSYIFWYGLKIKSELLVPHKWWKASNFVLFTSILLIQNGFAILTQVFAKYFEVDLNVILQILFPIGTITVMIALLIKNMLSSQVSAVKKAIKSIGSRVSAFRIFYYTQGEESLEDYTFVSQLPLLVKIPLESGKIDAKKAFQLMKEVNEATIFFQQHFTNIKEYNYMTYHLFNEITDLNEIKEIKANALKSENAMRAQK